MKRRMSAKSASESTGVIQFLLGSPARRAAATAAWLVCVAILAACGSTAAVGNNDGGGLPFGGADGGRLDGGSEQDGGATAEDGGAATVDGGARADGGPTAMLKILPGEGLDVASPSSGQTINLRVGATYGQLQSAVGAGMNSALFAGDFDRSYNDAYFLFFTNTDETGGMAAPTLTAGDKVRYLSTSTLFTGKTAGGTGPGSARSAWLAELGQPDHTQTNLDIAGETQDIYFTKGVVVAYNAGNVATAYTVQRSLKKPDLTVEVRNRRIGTITHANASASGGSAGSTVEQVWGAADQIDNYTIPVSGFNIAARNYSYLTDGLVFITVQGLSGYTVNGIIFFDPYYGKMDIANLGPRSTKAEFDTAMTTGACASETVNVVNQTWRVYKWSGTACDVRVGGVFDAQNRARTLWLNVPAGT